MAIEAGDQVILLEPATGDRFLVNVDGEGTRKERGLGVWDPGRLEGLQWGSDVTVAGKELKALRPTLPDLQATLRRKAQIIQPKDASRIVHELGLAAGDRVLESGIGSGAATMALVNAVAPDGEVVVQELREDFAKWAQANLERAGIAKGVSIAIGDLTKGLAPEVAGPFQGCLLDQPEPWAALGHIKNELAIGATVVAFCPQVSQMESTYKTMEKLGFAQIRAMELIERQWEVKQFGSRPSFDGLGHTAFLVMGRWLGQ